MNDLFIKKCVCYGEPLWGLFWKRPDGKVQLVSSRETYKNIKRMFAAESNSLIRYSDDDCVGGRGWIRERWEIL